MKREMTFLARGLKCGCLGENGDATPGTFSQPDAASSPSWLSRYASARPPIPSPVRNRNSLREGGRTLERGGSLLDIDELVQVEHHVAKVGEGRHRRIGRAFGCMVAALFFEERTAFG